MLIILSLSCLILLDGFSSYTLRYSIFHKIARIPKQNYTDKNKSSGGDLSIFETNKQDDRNLEKIDNT
uniref:Uncharacterized protein n=1 Tax=Romanomermis culicivorax TaxID=13658 RepID=A0A915IQ45_ROMCU